MLVLSRKVGEEISVGPNVRIKVLQIRGNRIRLGIVAPRSMPVHRGEIQSRILTEMSSMNLNDVLSANCPECGGA